MKFFPGENAVVQHAVVVAVFGFVHTCRRDPALATLVGDPAIVFGFGEFFQRLFKTLLCIGIGSVAWYLFAKPQPSGSQLYGDVVGLFTIRFLVVLGERLPFIEWVIRLAAQYSFWSAFLAM